MQIWYQHCIRCVAAMLQPMAILRTGSNNLHYIWLTGCSGQIRVTQAAEAKVVAGNDETLGIHLNLTCYSGEICKPAERGRWDFGRCMPFTRACCPSGLAVEKARSTFRAPTLSRMSPPCSAMWSTACKCRDCQPMCVTVRKQQLPSV